MNDGDLLRDSSFRDYMQTCLPQGLLYIGTGSSVDEFSGKTGSPEFYRIDGIHQVSDESVRQWLSGLSEPGDAVTATDCAVELPKGKLKADSVHPVDGSSLTGNAGKLRLMTVLELSCSDPKISELLGKATRMFPECLMVACHCSLEEGAGCRDSLFFAFGFHRLARVPDYNIGQDTVRWYEYRMSQYKPPPDWLNARFWANPQRFDVIEDPDLYSEEE